MADRATRQARTRATEFRAVEDGGTKHIDGYFAVFGSVYELWPGATESIDPAAFEGALGDDIRALTNHDTTLVLGRNKAGTLTLRADERGLWGEITVNPDDGDATNLYARVQRGDVDQCSFGFDILDEQTTFNPDGSVHWTIKRVKLYEISVVTFPAYEDTSVEARKADLNQIRRRENDAWKSRMKARLNHAQATGAGA